jgi:hypothetical protein
MTVHVNELATTVEPEPEADEHAGGSSEAWQERLHLRSHLARFDRDRKRLADVDCDD